MIDGSERDVGDQTPLHRIDTLKDALQQSERKLTAAARLARLGYWEDDVVADRLSWSEETCRVIGLPLGERTRPWDKFRELVHPDDWRLVEDARARMRGGEPGFKVAFRGILPDASLRHVEATAEAIKNEHGQIVRIVGAIQDVSERKQVDAVLRGSPGG